MAITLNTLNDHHNLSIYLSREGFEWICTCHMHRDVQWKCTDNFFKVKIKLVNSIFIVAFPTVVFSMFFQYDPYHDTVFSLHVP